MALSEELDYKEFKKGNCIICLKNPPPTTNGRVAQFRIYEDIIEQRIENLELDIIICSTCDQKLLDIINFRRQCQSALKFVQEFKVKFEIGGKIKEEPAIECDDSDYFMANDPIFVAVAELDDVPEENPENLSFCSVCQRQFLVSLATHVEMQHLRLMPSGQYACKLCDAKSFKSLNSAATHFSTKHGKEESSYTPNNHMTNDSNDERPYSCKLCSERFRRKETLRKHSYSHSQTRPFNCLLCNTGYYMASYLRGHYERSHGIVYTNRETLINCRREKPPIG